METVTPETPVEPKGPTPQEVYQKARQNLFEKYDRSLNKAMPKMLQTTATIAYRKGFTDCEMFFAAINIEEQKK